MSQARQPLANSMIIAPFYIIHRKKKHNKKIKKYGYNSFYNHFYVYGLGHNKVFKDKKKKER
jgi:hypothetical protein